MYRNIYIYIYAEINKYRKIVCRMNFSIKVMVIKNDFPENFSIPLSVVVHVIVTIVRISYIVEYLITCIWNHMCANY